MKPKWVLAPISRGWLFPFIRCLSVHSKLGRYPPVVKKTASVQNRVLLIGNELCRKNFYLWERKEVGTIREKPE